MIERIVVVLTVVGVCAGTGYAGLTATGDVTPADPATWTDATSVYVGQTGTGAVDITAGDTTDAYAAHVGDESGASGEVTVDGAGSSWDIVYPLRVGDEGDGLLTITNGGTVSSGSMNYVGRMAGSTGEVNIDGAGSSWTHDGHIWIGESGQGEVNVTNGGSFVSYHSDAGTMVMFGLYADSVGSITVDGPGSTWTGDAGTGLSVGVWGSGTLSITNGGSVALGGLSSSIGLYAGSTNVATVDGTGSLLDLQGSLSVGSGTLNVTDGGQVDVGRSLITRLGAASEIHFDNGSVEAGALYAAPGQLTGAGIVNAHGLASDLDLVFDSVDDLTQTFIWDDLPGQDVTVNLDVDGQGGLGAGHDGVGSMTIASGMDVTSVEGIIGYNAGSNGAVTVDGSGSAWRNDVELTVGWEGAATLTISDDALVTVGSWGLTIDENSDGDSFVNMRDGGMLALRGNADDSLEDFLDLIEGTDAIRYWDGAAEDWAPLIGATYGEDYTLEYMTEGELQYFTVLTVSASDDPGITDGDLDDDGDADADDIDLLCANMGGDLDPYDLNEDGVVDEDDMIFHIEMLVEWDNGVDSGVGTYQGDFNLDGVVNATDLQILKGNFGQVAAAVPEPLTMGLLSLGGLALLRRR